MAATNMIYTIVVYVRTHSATAGNTRTNSPLKREAPGSRAKNSSVESSIEIGGLLKL